jgi:hypothetical protein
MVGFQTKNTNLGKFGWVLQWKLLVYFMAIWSILRPFGIFLAISYILWLFGIFFPFWYVPPRKIWQPCAKFRFHDLKKAFEKSTPNLFSKLIMAPSLLAIFLKPSSDWACKLKMAPGPGLPDGIYFQTKNPNLVNFGGP